MRGAADFAFFACSNKAASSHSGMPQSKRHKSALADYADMKIAWASAEYGNAKYLILGIPDSSGSHSKRHGTDKAPDRIRQASNERDVYERNSRSMGRPFYGSPKPAADYGNISRSEIGSVYESMPQSMIPIALGGDHSITSDTIRAVSKRTGPLSLAYFDAHPDFVSSASGYYGSVLHDSLPYIDTKSSVLIGIRTPEQEEIDNINRHGLEVITPSDMQERGVQAVRDAVLQKIRSPAYVSFDMDCIDPAFAPGVSVPVPGGISSADAIYLLRALAPRMAAMDIMEVSPDYDFNDMTSHLASRIIAEAIYGGQA